MNVYILFAETLHEKDMLTSDTPFLEGETKSKHSGLICSVWFSALAKGPGFRYRVFCHLTALDKFKTDEKKGNHN